MPWAGRLAGVRGHERVRAVAGRDREPRWELYDRFDGGIGHHLRELHEHERFPGHRFRVGGELQLQSRIRFCHRRRQRSGNRREIDRGGETAAAHLTLELRAEESGTAFAGQLRGEMENQLAVAFAHAREKILQLLKEVRSFA